jgi:anti-sigma factor RsiW
MNCELAHEQIVMAEYGELPDDAAHELARHLAICPECGRERETLRALKLLADSHSTAEPDANLMARSRLRLEEALDTLPPRRWYERIAHYTGNSLARLQSAPVAAALMLVIGGLAGSLGGYYVAQSHIAKASEAAQDRNGIAAGAQAVVQAAAPSVAGEIASISRIERQPNSEQVQVSYSQIVPRQVTGSLDDTQIRHFLTIAAVRSAASGEDDGSVDLVAAECRDRHACRASGLSDALLMVLRYGRSAEMRRKALAGLAPYVADDLEVRNAVLEALLYDSDVDLRTDAVHALAPVEADTSVRQVLHNIASSDPDQQIRLVSREALSQAPEIQ